MVDLPPLPAQDPPAIVITGQALPRAKSDQAYVIDQFDRRRIEQSPSQGLDQLLKEVPGLQLFRRSDSRSGHPTSQGVTLRALGGNASSRALLVLDGVPQSDPFGGWVNWPAYDPDAIGEIRVVRGGGSVANGPGALAGTIDMTSRSDSGVGAEASVGSRESLLARARIGTRVAGGVLGLSGRWERGDGFIPIIADTRGPADEPAPYRAWNGRARWAGPIGREIELQAGLSGFDDRRSRGTDFTDNRTEGADASLRMVGRGLWQWSALAYLQWRDFQSSFSSVSDGRQAAMRVSLQDAVPSHGIGGSIELRPPVGQGAEVRVGADVRRADGETRELFSFVDGEPTRRRIAGGETSTAGVFADASIELDTLSISAGARLDRWSVSDGRLFERSLTTDAVLRDDAYRDRSGWLPTARVGATAAVSRTATLRAAAYLGWRMATLNELFRPFRAGADATAANAELEPERLSGMEVGIGHSAGPFRVSATAFVNRLSDAIFNVTLGEGPGTFPGVGFVAAGGQYRQRRNVDGVTARGLEASAEWTEGPWFARAAASWVRARVRAKGIAEALDGLRPAQTPAFAATLSLGWADERKAAQLVLRQVGAQFEDDLNQRSLKAATTMDAMGAWPIARTLQLVARGENLWNESVIAGIGGDGSKERAAPRTVWLGIRFRR